MWRARAILSVAGVVLLLAVSGAIVAVASETPAAQSSAGAHGSWSTGPTYNVTFNETGLPAGTNWSVQVTGMWGGWGSWNHRGHEFRLHYVHPETTNGTSLNFSLPNGTYSYHAESRGFVSTDGRGVFTVSGASPAVITVNFTPRVTYSVTFTETGLPAATNWTVAVFGGCGGWYGARGHGFQVETSNTSTITFQLANGTYEYHVFEVPGFVANASGGRFAVNGTSPAEIETTFSPAVTYSVFFNETGLPAGTSWSVQAFGNGHGWQGSWATATSSTANITLNLTNGTYYYAIGHVPGFRVASGEEFGMFTIDGASPPEITVEFTQGNPQ
jgi:hypothetical protein